MMYMYMQAWCSTYSYVVEANISILLPYSSIHRHLHVHINKSSLLWVWYPLLYSSLVQWQTRFFSPRTDGQTSPCFTVFCGCGWHEIYRLDPSSRLYVHDKVLVMYFPAADGRALHLSIKTTYVTVRQTASGTSRIFIHYTIEPDAPTNLVVLRPCVISYWFLNEANKQYWISPRSPTTYVVSFCTWINSKRINI